MWFSLYNSTSSIFFWGHGIINCIECLDLRDDKVTFFKEVWIISEDWDRDGTGERVDDSLLSTFAVLLLFDANSVFRVDQDSISKHCRAAIIRCRIPADNHVYTIIYCASNWWLDLFWGSCHQTVKNVGWLAVTVNVFGWVSEEVRKTFDQVSDDMLSYERFIYCYPRSGTTTSLIHFKFVGKYLCASCLISCQLLKRDCELGSKSTLFDTGWLFCRFLGDCLHWNRISLVRPLWPADFI